MRRLRSEVDGLAAALGHAKDTCRAIMTATEGARWKEAKEAHRLASDFLGL